MNNFIDDEDLDRQLREAAVYIDDDGFTARMVQQLPARSAPMRLRSVVLVAAALLASVLTYVLSGGGRFLSDFVVRVSELPLLWLVIVTFIAGLMVGAFGLVAAISKTRQAPLLAR
ncbi:MAG TPA: DUF5056 domain-containing protein [Chthoniobacterales bacterium]|jgi:hypothetical protein